MVRVEVFQSILNIMFTKRTSADLTKSKLKVQDSKKDSASRLRHIKSILGRFSSMDMNEYSVDLRLKLYLIDYTPRHPLRAILECLCYLVRYVAVFLCKIILHDLNVFKPLNICILLQYYWIFF